MTLTVRQIEIARIKWKKIIIFGLQFNLVDSNEFRRKSHLIKTVNKS